MAEVALVVARKDNSSLAVTRPAEWQPAPFLLCCIMSASLEADSRASQHLKRNVRVNRRKSVDAVIGACGRDIIVGALGDLGNPSYKAVSLIIVTH